MTDFAQTRQAVVLIVVPDMPDIQSEDDVAHIIADRLRAADLMLQPGDVIAVAQKIVSKAEGRFVDLTSVQPDSAAVEVAQQTEKDPRLVQVILDESDEISRMAPGVLVVRHKLGFVSANAGSIAPIQVRMMRMSCCCCRWRRIFRPKNPAISANGVRCPGRCRHH